MAKWILAMVMLGIGAVHTIHPRGNSEIGAVWLVGSILLLWMPEGL